ncbi:MAG: CTP-dependent riboflavin kinase [Desulfurococcales archaeon]|nr:CTP-dependent riboflavin kinase [Desulfurococcales archaeon]
MRRNAITIKGKVFSGRGEGAFYVSIYAKQFEAAIGYRPYPGTLNIMLDDEDAVKLDKCLKTLKPIIVEPPKIEGARLGGVYLYPARVYKDLNSRDVYIVRPMITHYKINVVELLSNVYLRGMLNVVDGDEVTVEVSCAPTS